MVTFDLINQEIDRRCFYKRGTAVPISKRLASSFMKSLTNPGLHHFLCNLRSLRSYRRAKTRAMNPITAKVVNAMSMFDIILHLHSINNKS